MNSKGYLDIHSHILPGIDDGSKNWDMTREMLTHAYNQGTRIMVATPHNYPHKSKQDNDAVRELVRKANEMAKEIGPDFTILEGNEILYRDGIPDEIENNHILPLAGTRCLLVEFLPGEEYKRILHGIRELTEYGYYPIIAHVERVHALFQDIDNIEEIIEMGCFLQTNTGSLMGGMFDKKSARLRKLIKDGQIHFLGSDCHNTDTRPARMEDAVSKLYKKIPEKDVDRLLYGKRRYILPEEC